MNPQRFWAVVPAAGVGQRMGADVPKQYLEVLGKPVLQHTLERLLSVEAFSGIAVALGEEDGYWMDLPCAHHPKIRRAPGGKERADSVLSALNSLEGSADPDDWVLVHDAARPCLTKADVEKLLDSLRNDPVGGILALPVSDTLKAVDGGDIVETLDRSRIWRALTPQMFRYGILRQALRDAAGRKPVVTDEAGAVELLGLRPKVVEGRADNIKITRPEDLPLAAFYLASILSREPGDASPVDRPGKTQTLETPMAENFPILRIGQGYDAHKFQAGDRIVIGGVTIPFGKGMAAHSDGDVALHALCDALLGAAALGDIGKHFPDTDAAYRGIDSRILLRSVAEKLSGLGYSTVNVDVTLVAQAPRMAPHIPQMRERIAADLAIDADSVNVKATTTEGMGFEGRGEGISAYAVALLQKKPAA